MESGGDDGKIPTTRKFVVGFYFLSATDGLTNNFI